MDCEVRKTSNSRSQTQQQLTQSLIPRILLGIARNVVEFPTKVSNKETSEEAHLFILPCRHTKLCHDISLVGTDDESSPFIMTLPCNLHIGGSKVSLFSYETL